VAAGKMEDRAMKTSTTLIWFFVQVALLAVTYAATGISGEGEESHFEIVTLDETTSCIA
jgi:hypothetical protein